MIKVFTKALLSGAILRASLSSLGTWAACPEANYFLTLSVSTAIYADFLTFLPFTSSFNEDPTIGGPALRRKSSHYRISRLYAFLIIANLKRLL